MYNEIIEELRNIQFYERDCALHMRASKCIEELQQQLEYSRMITVVMDGIIDELEREDLNKALRIIQNEATRHYTMDQIHALRLCIKILEDIV